MKYMKILGLLSVAAAALTAFTASALATQVTAPAGTVYTGTVKGVNQGAVSFDGTLEVTCNSGSIEGTIEQHGTSVTAKGRAVSFNWSECGDDEITGLVRGTVEVHPLGNGNGTVTSSGTEATVLADTIFGTVHCIFTTNNTHIGTVTGATSNSGHATVHLEGAIPRTGGTSGFLCGSSAEITGAGKVTSPTGLRID
jgi:hypothetical protein